MQRKDDRRCQKRRLLRHLVVMVKEPVAGRVKTRLARDAGVAVATRFARTTARNVIGRLDQPRRWRLHLAIDPPGGLASRALPAGPRRFTQRRGDLGARMQAIMDRLHRSFNVSVADADSGPSGEIDRTVLVVVAVGRARRDARLILDRVADAVAAHPRTEVLAHDFTEV